MKLLLAALLISLSSYNVRACEVALALTVDVSGSVDKAEYHLQMKGLAGALRDDEVSEALVVSKAAIMLIHWTGNTRQAIVLPWARIRSHEQLAEIADQVEVAPRSWRHFSTAIGDALIFTANQFHEVPECERKVIDVSGDGRSNEGALPQDVRFALVKSGFVINGLAIEGSEKDLTGYYNDHVIAGPNAFVMTAQSFQDYPDRIRRKMIREVSKQIVMLNP